MKRQTVIWILAGLAMLFSAVFLVTLIETAGPKLATGASPTTSGYAWVLSSFLAFVGTSGGAILTAVLPKLGVSVPAGGIQSADVAEIVELTSSFAALIKDSKNKAYQRRFLFALVDSCRFIDGCKAGHENGIVTISYSGFADPATPPSA